jgi:hypothetical protein
MIPSVDGVDVWTDLEEIYKGLGLGDYSLYIAKANARRQRLTMVSSIDQIFDFPKAKYVDQALALNLPIMF